MIIIVISVVIGICCIQWVLQIISSSNSILVIRYDSCLCLFEDMLIIDCLIIVQLFMLLNSLVVMLVRFCLVYLWLCWLGVLVMFLMICVVIIDFSRFMIVSVVDIGSSRCSVFQVNGIFGNRNVGRLFGSVFMLLIVCIFQLNLIDSVVSIMIVISGDGIVWVSCGSRQMIVSLVVYIVYICQDCLISLGICVRKIRMVRVLMKLVIIECDMKCMRVFSFNVLVIICSRLVRIVVVSRYCRLWLWMRLIIIRVIVLVVVEIMLGWLSVMVVIIVMQNDVYKLILGLMLVMIEKVIVLGISVSVMMVLDSRLLWILLSYCWCSGQEMDMKKFYVLVWCVVCCVMEIRYFLDLVLVWVCCQCVVRVMLLQQVWFGGESGVQDIVVLLVF